MRNHEKLVATLDTTDCGNIKKAVKEKRIKLEFYYAFDKLIPSIMTDKINEIAADYGVEINDEDLLEK